MKIKIQSFLKNFPKAGLIINAHTDYYTIISLNKGGVVAHFSNDKLLCLDAGVVIRNSKGQLGSTQAFNNNNNIELDGNILTIESTFVPMPKRLPNPLQFIVLRLLGITFFRFRILREWVKQLLVRLLISPQKKWPIKNKRKIILGLDLSVSDTSSLPEGYTKFENPGQFVSVHMASQGYWQIQDEENRN